MGKLSLMIWVIREEGREDRQSTDDVGKQKDLRGGEERHVRDRRSTDDEDPVAALVHETEDCGGERGNDAGG